MSYLYGDIILIHGDNAIAGAIKNLTDSFFSHAALCTEKNMVAEMLHDGFKYHSNRYWRGQQAYIVLRHKQLIYSPPPAAYAIRQKMRQVIEQYRQHPPRYDYFEILRLAVKLLKEKGQQMFRGGQYYFTEKELLEIGQRLICSAMVDTVYEKAGIDLFPGRIPRDVTPADLASLAREPGNVLEIIDTYIPL
ncbi:MAG: hypothetical protein ACUVTU_07210 [Desulfurispora sp.]|uniref:hypothetical protein n=1 Tax=Desulfurispora sp. TaxID=3014275 RepID=UPI00404AE4D3